MRKAFIPEVLAALIASGCAATASGVASHHPARAAHQGCPKLAASRSPRAGGVLLDAGQTGTRTQVPWAKVRGLWLVPVNGAAPRRLSPPRNGHGVDPAGDIGAWRLPSGLYLQAVGACSQIYIVRQLPSADGMSWE